MKPGPSGSGVKGHRDTTGLLATAAAAGTVAGLVMSAWMMTKAAISGAGIWRPPNLIATIVLGPSANSGTFDLTAFLTGMVLHLLTSIGMGLVYAALSARLPPRTALVELAVFVAYALLSWATYQWLIMPWLAPTMAQNTSPVSLAVAHVVFAVAFAAWWLLHRKRNATT